MSRELGSRLPIDIIAEVSKESPRFNAIPLVSIDQEGFPHVALLSYFELAYCHQELYFFINSFSRSSKFLRERSRCALIFVHSDFVYYLKGRTRQVTDFDSQTVFQFKLEAVLEDFPSAEEGEVFLKTGIRFGSAQEETGRRADLRQKVIQLIEQMRKV
ncbi:MAG: pyridoxamine 5'-phosphate oxidase family protein [Acidobacteriota bacterium]